MKKEAITHNVWDDLNTRNENWQEIEDNQINITNEIENGDFSSGSSGWRTMEDTTIDVGFATIKNTRYSGVRQDDINGSVNDIFYVSMVILENTLLEKLILTDNSISASGMFNPKFFEKITGFTSAISTVKGAGRRFMISNPRQYDSGFVKITNIIAFNLTQAFGVGNEPTKEQMDKLMEIIGWFDGTKTLTQLEQLNWLLALNRQQAQITDGLVGV